MNVQEVFNKIIDSGYYHHYRLMCFAATDCADQRIITKEEHDVVDAEIKAYLKGYGSLAGALDNKGFDYSFEHRLTIYKDWGNKPTL